MSAIELTLFGKMEIVVCFLWSVACVLSLTVWILLLVMSLVGYQLQLWLFLDIFCTTFDVQKSKQASRKHAFIILTPLYPTFIQ